MSEHFIDLALVLKCFLKPLSWFQKHKKVKRYDKSKLCISVKDWRNTYVFFEETRKLPRIVFVFLSGETKQLSLLGNYWALLSIYGNLIYTTEAQCLELKWLPISTIWRMKKALKDERENFPRDFLPLWTTTKTKGIFQKQI